MHGEPSRAWKLAELAKAAGMSRTSFAVHFRSIAGVAPLAYLAEWRMRIARRMLRRQEACARRLGAPCSFMASSSTAAKCSPVRTRPTTAFMLRAATV